MSEKKQLDSIQMEELYAQAQSMMRETVSEEFKDLFAEYDTFYRKIESILNKLLDSISKYKVNKIIKKDKKN